MTPKQPKYRIMKRGREYRIEEFKHFKKSKRKERRYWGHFEYQTTIRTPARDKWVNIDFIAPHKKEHIGRTCYANGNFCSGVLLKFSSRAQAVACIRKEFGEEGVSQIKQPEWQEC